MFVRNFVKSFGKVKNNRISLTTPEHLFKCKRSLLAVNERSYSTEAQYRHISGIRGAPSLSVLEAKFPVRAADTVDLLHRGGIMIIKLIKR